jgi:hypothetical protein
MSESRNAFVFGWAKREALENKPRKNRKEKSFFITTYEKDRARNILKSQKKPLGITAKPRKKSNGRGGDCRQALYGDLLLLGGEMTIEIRADSIFFLPASYVFYGL